MNKELEKIRDELGKHLAGEEYKQFTCHFDVGFNACYEQMLPLIDALKFYGIERPVIDDHDYPVSHEEQYPGDMAKDLGKTARAALKKIGEIE